MDGLCGVTGYETCDALKQAAFATGACAVKKSAEVIESVYNTVISTCDANGDDPTWGATVCVGTAFAVGTAVSLLGVGAFLYYAATARRAAILSAVGMAGLAYAVTRLEC